MPSEAVRGNRGVQRESVSTGSELGFWLEGENGRRLLLWRRGRKGRYGGGWVWLRWG